MMKKIIKIDNKGSALLTVLLIMTVLVVLGMGVIANSTNNLTATSVVSVSERSYYASEDAAQVAVSTIKNEVSKYYMTMMEASTYSAYLALYDNFFSYLSGRLTGSDSILTSPDFIENELDGQTTVSCSMSTPETQDTGYLSATFTVTCVTTIDGIANTVTATLEVEAAPLDYQWTTAPALTSSMLLSGGNVEVDCETSENYLEVSGGARIAGSNIYSCGFYASELTENDASVEDLLIWQLYYDQFDSSIANPTVPTKVTPSSASNKYYFTESTTLDKGTTGKDIYVAGNLTITDTQVNNCNIYVTGNVFISNTGDPDRLKGTSIYAEGNIFINASNFWPDGNHRMYYYAGGNISVILGQGGHGSDNRSGVMENVDMTAMGNITITSAYGGSQEDIITNCAIWAGGNIEISGSSYLDNPLIDQIENSTFEARDGDISIVSTYMQSNNKIAAGDDVIIATYGMTNTEVYADDTITIDSSRLYSASQTQYYSDYCKIVAANDLTIINSSFRYSYFYSGENLTAQLTSGYSLNTCILYSEEDAYYDNTWAGNMDTMQSSLFYTNGDFYYSASGTYTSTTPAGVQIMAKGSIYSYEGDDSSNATDKMIFGEGSYMNLTALQSMIGTEDSHTGTLADVLDAAGFEHDLPEPIVTLPYYTEVYTDESYS